MVDQLVRTGSSGLQSSGNILAVTPSGTDLAYITRGVYVGGTGDLTVITQAGQTVTFSAVPAGTTLPICVSRITAATTATLILALL